MEKSNIVAGSNVYYCETDDPRLDAEFVEQVVDYPLLKEIHYRGTYDVRVPQMTEKQTDILKTDMRCVYAKNDPCWGYVESAKKVMCACINSKCPDIQKCNPGYSYEMKREWRMLPGDKKLYGSQKNLRRYYKVDLVSDEEMSRYYVSPENEGLEYGVNPVLKDPKKVKEREPEHRINPNTGLKEYIVGYKWVIIDQGSYEGEELQPIWGPVQEYLEKHPVVKKATQKIQKKADIIEKKEIDEEAFQIDLFEDVHYQMVVESVESQLKLIEATPEDFVNMKSVIILSNPAELAYTSSVLNQNGIDHGRGISDNVQLTLVGDIIIQEKMIVWLSDSILKEAHIDNHLLWEQLSSVETVKSLIMPRREYYNFAYGDNRNRWCCRNMYGVTHVCIETCDIQELELEDGIYRGTIERIEDGYVFRLDSGTEIGYLSETFVELIGEMIEAEEISGEPDYIKGITIKVRDRIRNILGMGNLKFSDY